MAVLLNNAIGKGDRADFRFHRIMMILELKHLILFQESDTLSTVNEFCYYSRLVTIWHSYDNARQLNYPSELYSPYVDRLPIRRGRHSSNHSIAFKPTVKVDRMYHCIIL